MTNSATPTPPSSPTPPSPAAPGRGGGGGMPPWLIVALVVGLVVVLGCCGGLTMCVWGGRHAARRVQELRAVQAGLPADVPVMPGFTAPGIQASNAANGVGVVVLRGNASRVEVVAYYQKQMKDIGWSESSSQAIGPTTVMVFVKDSRQVTIQVLEAGGSTMLTIQYGPKP